MAAIAILAIVTADGWRTAALALAAALAILVTRVRFTREVALLFLAAAAALALSGTAPAGDERPSRANPGGPIATGDRPDRHR